MPLSLPKFFKFVLIKIPEGNQRTAAQCKANHEVVAAALGKGRRNSALSKRVLEKIHSFQHPFQGCMIFKRFSQSCGNHFVVCLALGCRSFVSLREYNC